VGWDEELPDDAFKDSERPTGVKTRLVIIDKSDTKPKREPLIDLIRDIAHVAITEKAGETVPAEIEKIAEAWIAYEEANPSEADAAWYQSWERFWAANPPPCDMCGKREHLVLPDAPKGSRRCWTCLIGETKEAEERVKEASAKSLQNYVKLGYLTQEEADAWPNLPQKATAIIPISECITLREATFRTPMRPQTTDHIPTYVRSPKPKGYRNDKVVYAREDISVANNVYILKGTPGRIETCGAWALNVKFEGHRHAMLCTYDMVSEVKPRELKKLHNSPFKTGQVVTITTQGNIVGVVDNIRFDGVHFIQTQDTERFKYGVCTALEWELKTVAIVPAGERRTLIDVVWNAPNPTFIPTGDPIVYIYVPASCGIQTVGILKGETHTPDYFYVYIPEKDITGQVHRNAFSYTPINEQEPDGLKIKGKVRVIWGEYKGKTGTIEEINRSSYKSHENYCVIRIPEIGWECVYRLHQIEPINPPQPLTPEKTLTEQPKRPLKKGDRVRVTGCTNDVGMITVISHYKKRPDASHCTVSWSDGRSGNFNLGMLEMVEDEPIKNQPQIMAENMPDDWMAPTMRSILGPDPVHGLNDHKRFFPNTPIEPLPINCAGCGQPVGLETVVFNKKTYCLTCGEPKLREEQDETLFLQKLSDAPDEDTPAPRVIEQPPQPEIPMKQLSLFGD
jgi:hypothetical protein